MNLNKEPFSFSSVEDFFKYSHGSSKRANQIRKIIKQSIPNCKEKLSWGIPMFCSKKYICYLTYRCDEGHKDKALDSKDIHLFLGFYVGHKMFDPENIFEETTHSQIRYIKIQDSISDEMLKDYLLQALDFDS